MTTRFKKAPPPPLQIQIGGGFLLLISLIYFFDNSGLIAAITPPIIIHELGHVFALRCFGAFPIKLKADMSGLSFDYIGDMSHLQSALSALGGPFAGLISSLLFARLGGHFESEFLLLCGGLGFILNIFNLLPIWPLDGGRVLYHLLAIKAPSHRAFVISSVLGWGFLSGLMSLGLLLIVQGRGAAALLAGIWLVVLRYRSCK